jgi:hypothetical protein
MTIEDYLEDAARSDYDEYEEYSYFNDNCEKKIDMYYCGWECDTKLWIMKNGDKICTNHGDYYIVSDGEFNYYRENLENYINSIKDL